MLDKLKPDEYYQDIFSINLEKLHQEGIRGLICDIDNTIVPWSEDSILEEVVDWFDQVRKRGFKVCFVSNGKANRVRYFSENLGLPALSQAVKPTKRAFRLAKMKLELQIEEIAVIGDQIFTDIYGGNRLGFKTILVDPMSREEFFMTKIMRILEKLVFQRGRKG